MQKILQLRGLPGSGKSTYAKALVTSDHTYKRINRDDLRAMLHNSDWSEESENWIILAEETLAKLFINQGFNLVIDDTGLSTNQLNLWEKFAKDHNAELEVKFIDTPIEECIKRDIIRPYGVGERVIRQMYEKYLMAHAF